MQLLEGQFILAGYEYQCAILGNQVSVELKITRGSLLFFDICKPNLQLIVYEIPYMNTAAMGLLTLSAIESQIPLDFKCDFQVKSKRSFIADDAYLELPKFFEDALKTTCNWYSRQVSTKSDSPQINRLECIIMSLMYCKGEFKATQDFSWHLVVSEVYDPKDHTKHTIHTTHNQLTHAEANKEVEKDLFSGKFNTFRPLRFHARFCVEFNVNGKAKQLNAILWHQRWEPVSSLQNLSYGGFKALSRDWKSAVFSLNGIHFMMFMLMIAMLFLGSSFCTGVLEEQEQRNKMLLQQYNVEVADGERPDSGFIRPKDTSSEEICRIQKNYIG